MAKSSAFVTSDLLGRFPQELNTGEPSSDGPASLDTWGPPQGPRAVVLITALRFEEGEVGKRKTQACGARGGGTSFAGEWGSSQGQGFCLSNF